MSKEVISLDTSLKKLTNQLIELNKNIVLIFAFNSTGKTRLSVEYKNITKQNNEDNHSVFIIMPIAKICFIGIMM